MQSLIVRSFSVFSKLCILLLIFGVGSAPIARAQITQHAPAPTPSTPSPAAPSDPLELGRETPRGTVIGFVRAAQAENYDVAVQYFEPRRRTNVEPEREFAQQLLAILNTRFRGSLEAITNALTARP